jgi:hypothetical protein
MGKVKCRGRNGYKAERYEFTYVLRERFKLQELKGIIITSGLLRGV